MPSAEISAGRREIAQWTMTAEPGATPEAVNAWTCRVARAFAGAFGDLARPERGLTDLMWLDGERRVARVVEGTPATLDELCGDDFAPLITAFHLEPDGVSLYAGCVVDFDVEERVTPAECRATVTLHVRVDPATVTAALHEWERLAGVEITEWVGGSRYGL